MIVDHPGSVFSFSYPSPAVLNSNDRNPFLYRVALQTERWGGGVFELTVWPVHPYGNPLIQYWPRTRPRLGPTLSSFVSRSLSRRSRCSSSAAAATPTGTRPETSLDRLYQWYYIVMIWHAPGFCVNFRHVSVHSRMPSSTPKEILKFLVLPWIF